jgi:hypothetical protein
METILRKQGRDDIYSRLTPFELGNGAHVPTCQLETIVFGVCYLYPAEDIEDVYPSW